MESAIEQIMFGKRTENTMKRTPRCKELLDELIEKEKEFVKMLTDEEIEAFIGYKEAQELMDGEECIEYYKEGFRFGVLLAFDVLKA